jgi:hypothetical protein
MPDDPRILPFAKPTLTKPGLTIRANVTVERSWNRTPVTPLGNEGKAQPEESTENPQGAKLQSGSVERKREADHVCPPSSNRD